MQLNAEQRLIVSDIAAWYAAQGMPRLLGVALGFLESHSLDPWNRTGDGGTSFGIFQIHVPAHPPHDGEYWLGREGTLRAMEEMRSRWVDAYVAASALHRFEDDPALFLLLWWKPAQGGSYPLTLSECQAAAERARQALALIDEGGMVEQPPITWVGAHPNNFAIGRGSVSLEAVVWHVTEGGMPGPWFNDPRARASTNFAVSKTGRIEQYVSLDDAAYAHGLVEVSEDDARALIRDNWGISPNLWAASIEFEGTREEVLAGKVPAPEQEAAAVRLTAWLFQDVLYDPAAQAKPPVDRDHVLMHRDISPRSRTCPVWNEVTHERMIAKVKALLQPAPAPPPPDYRALYRAELEGRKRAAEDDLLRAAVRIEDAEKKLAAL